MIYISDLPQTYVYMATEMPTGLGARMIDDLQLGTLSSLAQTSYHGLQRNRQRCPDLLLRPNIAVWR
jgi:hypothetical protein